MNPPPADWPRLSSSLYYDDPAAAIDFLERAFGFETRLRVDGAGGRVVHSELVYGGGLVMVSGAERESGEPDPVRVTPRAAGGRNTQSLFLYVDDIEAHCQRARAAGATITREPTTVDYGEDYWSDRGYEAIDCGGHRWYFAERLRSRA